MEKKPLAFLTALVVAGAGIVGYVTKDKWGAPVPVASQPQATEASKPAEPAKTEEASKPAEPVKTEEAAKPAEPAKIEEAAKPAEPPKTEEAAKPTEPAKAEEASKPVEPAKPEEQQQAAASNPPAEPPSEPAKPAAAPEAATPAAAAVIPSFDTVRVETGGNAIIAGRAAPGAEVTVKLNGTAIATGTANADGAFAIIPDKPLPAGPGVLSLEVKDKATGAVTVSEQTVAVAVKPADGSTPMVAVLTPDAPTKVVQAPADAGQKLPPMDSVNIDSVDYDEKGNMIFAGRGPAGSRVQLYMDNAPLAEATIGADGTWTVAPAGAIAVGAHALRADEIGADGAVKSRVEIPFFREDAAKVIASRTPPAAQPETTTENTTVTVKTPDQQTTVTATGPVTVEVTPEPAKPVEPAAAEPAKPEQPAQPAAAEPAKPSTEEPKAAEAPAAQPAEPAAQPAAEPAKPVEPAATEPPKAEEPQIAAATPPAEPVPEAKIVIQPGNNLWKLSRKIYGRGVLYTVIYEANREYIRNPNLIYPGQIFVTPNAPAKTEAQ